MDSNFSLSDLATVTNGNGFGGSGSWLLLVLFVLIFGNGGWGNNRGDYGQFATAASQQDILFGQKFSDLGSAINKVGDGLSSLGYSQLQQMDANTASINGNIVSEGRNLQNCCCDMKLEMANQFANANANTTAQTQRILDAMAADKIASLQSQVQTLQNQISLQNALGNVPKINPYMYGIVPTCGCNCGVQ